MEQQNPLIQNNIEMQQEQHAYAFQLQENTIVIHRVIAVHIICSHPHQMQFYCSTSKRENRNESILCRLNYSEENPRKSTTTYLPLKGRLSWIKTIGFDGEVAKMFANVGERGAELRYVNPQLFDKAAPIEIDQLELFYANQNTINEVLKGKDNHNLFLTLNKQIVSVDINKPAEAQKIVSIQDDQRNISHSAIDPARGMITYCLNNEIFITDKTTKTQKYTFKVSPSSKDHITNIHYNPNKQYYLMTGHHDFMKFWDIRKTNIPVKTVSDHHTLLLRAVYNHAHDELILGCYDDGSIGLYRMPSVSSSPSGEGSDALVKIYDEHEDSVYHACWSHSPWVFASVSYNSTNMVVNIVPSVEKYRILL